MAKTTVVRKNKAGNRLLDSFKAVVIGFVLVIVCLGAHACNEARSVKAIRAYAEAGEVLIEVGSANSIPANEGELVAVRGSLTFSPVTDPIYNIGVNSFVIRRNVEMYQWEEKQKGSSTDSETTYTYDTVWSDKPINSSRFYQKSGHENPSWPSDPRFQSDAVYSDDAMLGDFSLTKDQLAQLSVNVNVTPENAPPDLNISGNYITNYTGSPEVGSIRVSWRSSTVTESSALAKQSGTDLVNYITTNGTVINRVFAGSLTGEDMVAILHAENRVLTWILRILLTVFVCMGFGMMFTPVQVLVSFIPFLGRFLSQFTKGVAKLIGIIIGVISSLAIIIISWIAVRPLVAIPLLIVVGALIFILVRISKNKKTAAVSETVSAAAAIPAEETSVTEEPASPPQSFCTNCGNKLSPGASFCAECGQKAG